MPATPDSHSHMLHFHNGGVLRYVCDDAAKLIDVNAENLHSDLASGNELMFSL